jgi:uncharacterized membrane protein
VYLAADGPASWARVAPREQAAARPEPATVVSAISTSDDSVSFDVDQVGRPVLVKVSYFPNWEVDGADGPYRVAPNLMVVVPTSNHVSLHYGTTSYDRLGWLLTVAGIVLVVLLARRPWLATPKPELSSSQRLIGFLLAPVREREREHDDVHADEVPVVPPEHPPDG